MTQVPAQRQDASVALELLADGDRRRLLDHLIGRLTPISVRELATQLAAEQDGTALADVSSETLARVRTELCHTHLPALDEAGLLEWDSDANTVTAGEHPALDDPRFRRLLELDADAVVSAIAVDERRQTLAILADVDGRMDRETLARHTVARLHGVSPAEVPKREQQDMLVRLHHVHLPKLRQAELIAGDDDVRYRGHPELDAKVLGLDATEFGTRSTADIRTIEGRDDIVAHGQQLFDEADEELFLMITTDGLLDDECVRRLSAALARGVDVYVGSQSSDVRDLVRRRLPSAVIWEPQRDWLNLPPERERVGRLVFADREIVLLGTLGEPVDGEHRETALVGSGPDNGLVILLREMLGSRLDHLDAQSEDLLSQLPL
jgi:hypothetical protein